MFAPLSTGYVRALRHFRGGGCLLHFYQNSAHCLHSLPFVTTRMPQEYAYAAFFIPGVLARLSKRGRDPCKICGILLIIALVRSVFKRLTPMLTLHLQVPVTQHLYTGSVLSLYSRRSMYPTAVTHIKITQMH